MCLLCCCCCSNLALLAWVIFYWAILVALTQLQLNMASWDVEGPGGRVATDALNSITMWAAQYRCVWMCGCVSAMEVSRQWSGGRATPSLSDL